MCFAANFQIGLLKIKKLTYPKTKWDIYPTVRCRREATRREKLGAISTVEDRVPRQKALRRARSFILISCPVRQK